MTIDEMIRVIVAEEVAKAEARLRESLQAQHDRTMDVREAAAHLGVSEKLIYRMCLQKQIPHERYGAIGSKRPAIKLRLSDLEKWRKERRDSNYRGSSVHA